MKCSLRPPRYSVLCLGLAFILVCASAFAQGERVLTPPQRKKPINLDKELESPVAPDRAASYYHFSLAKFYEDNGDLSKALSEMEDALKYNQKSPEVHLEMAALLDKTGNTREAIENAQEAARLDPQDPDPHWVLVNIYFGGQRGAAATDGMQKGVQELEKLKELTPTDERVYYALGRAYFNLNNPEKAIEAYEKFQSLSTNADNGYREIAQYYDRKGDEEKAVEYLNKALKIQPDSPDSLGLLAQIYTKTSKNKEAVNVYRKLREVTGNNVNVSLGLAASLIDSNEFEEALKILDDMAKNPPVDAAVQTYRG